MFSHVTQTRAIQLTHLTYEKQIPLTKATTCHGSNYLAVTFYPLRSKCS